MSTFFVRFVAFVRRLLVAVFGRWQPPPWLAFLGRKARAAGSWARTHRAATAALAAGTLIAVSGAGLGYRWWKNRPKPITTEVSITAPALTRIADKMVPHPVVIDFGGSVAPLSAIGAKVTTGITLVPRFEGTWTWTTDKQLTFAPKSDWPVGERFEVKLGKKGLVAGHITLSTYELELQTAPFAVTLSEAEFYQDPVDPNLKKVVATFRFSHPVDPVSFEKAIAMRFSPSNKEERAFDAAVTVSYDKWKAQAFVHSAPFAVPQKDADMIVTLRKGTRAARGGPAFDEELSQSVRVPGLYNYFKVNGVEPTIVDNPRMEPEQVMVVRLSGGTTEDEMKKAISVVVLPVTNPDERNKAYAGTEKEPYRYGDPERISPAIVKAGRKLPLVQLAAEKEYADVHSFRYEAEVGRYLYVEIKKGARAFGGYVLGETYTTIVRVPAYPRQLKILHTGSLLALGGERKVSVFTRDIPGIRFEIARILPEQLHHFVSQSYGNFAQPGFSYSFGPENLADFHVEARPIVAKPGKPVYESVDLSKYLADGRRGLFIVRAQSWDPGSKNTLGEEDKRFVMVSDLGLLSKKWADGSQDVFVQNIRNGDPMSGVKLQVIGKNGLPVFTTISDGLGRGHFPSIAELRAEKTPVMLLASHGRDTAFLPLGRGDRQLDLSRFDVGGASEATSAQGLSAYLFSDRGVYRPGDEIRVGIIVKPKDWAQSLEGLPLQIEVIDARGLEVKRQRLTLGAVGFEEIRHKTPEVAPTGTYTVNVHTVKDGYNDALLGSTTVVVREFLPDRMIIKTQLSEERVDGWVSPNALKGRVTLTNLFGTPAVGRRIRAQVTLVPGLPSFGKLRDYRFYDPLKTREPVSQPLPDAETDDDGKVELDLGLARFANATYRLTFLAEGFEAEGGRSVTAEAGVVVSPLPHMIGWKADGDLGYMSKGSARKVELVAVGPNGERKALGGLKAVLLERKYVSILARQDNGTYKYESVRKEVERKRDALAIAAAGTSYALPTVEPGDFAISVRNDKDEEIQRIDFSVTGYGNLTRSMEKNAELQVALKSPDVEQGGTLEMQIKAPYAGAGLITIERDKVYASKWFKTSTTATVESIAVPPDVEGGGYVSVTFIRDPGSDEVFASPLSYGVVPFSISRAKRAIDLKVTSPDLAKPGEPFRMKVRADKPARAVVFAVDEGILRVARYDTPNPLAFFFQKRALGVSTTQILDLILPEHQRLLQSLAPGGDAEGEAAIGANLNPFKRRRDKPVAYWSGFVDVGPDERELVYDVPDSFNGTLRVMAVAVSRDAIGALEKKSLVRGDFVINPNAPTFVAPGDTFEVSVAVSNNVAGSGKKPTVGVSLKVSPHLEIVGRAKADLTIAELREGTTTFKLKAKEVLGSASMTFETALGDKRGRYTTDLSVRPAAPFQSTMQAGTIKNRRETVNVPRKLHAEYRDLVAGIATVPLQLAHGLAGYLETFPHGCTEQITSQAVPAVTLGKRPEFGYKSDKAEAAVAALVDTLRTRQNDEGAFGMWAANPRVVPEVTVYAMHVLTEARARGYAVPADLVRKGLDYLTTLAGHTPDDLAEGRTRAHAIYVLTRNEVVTTTFITAAQENLEANHPKLWKKDLAGAYLAASLKLLKQDGPAKNLIGEAKLGGATGTDFAHYYDGLAHDGRLLYLLARHFPERAAQITPEELDGLVKTIAGGGYNTHSSAAAVMGLEAYAERASAPGVGQRTAAEVIDGVARPLTLPANLLPTTRFSDKASALVFGSEGAYGAYWFINQRGFDRVLQAPRKDAKPGKLEVVRTIVDAEGKPLKEAKLGDEIRVQLRLRAIGQPIDNVAIVDLLPGGFEVVVQTPVARDEPSDEHSGEHDPSEAGEGEEGDEGESSENEVSESEASDEAGGHGIDLGTMALPIMLPETTFAPDYGDVREDRVVLYGTIGTDAQTFVYAIKATNQGTFVVPPIQAEGLYDRSVQARGSAGSITVKAP